MGAAQNISTDLLTTSQQEALIKTDLMKGIVKSDQVQGPMTFKALADAYLALPRVKEQANYERKQMWVEQRFLPVFGASTLITAITPESIEAYYQADAKKWPWPLRIGNLPLSNICFRGHVGRRGSYPSPIHTWTRTLLGRYGRRQKTMYGMRS
jgi:hypothetical protein